LWWTSFKTLVSQLQSQIDLTTIQRLALDATSGTVLIANQQGHAISPALMYNDARADLEAKEIQLLEPTNTALHNSSSGLAKILWLKRHYQPVQTDKFLHQADWIIGQLTGIYGITDYNNALKSGIDLRTKQWPNWFTQLGILQQLPVVTEPGTMVGLIKTKLASELGFSPQLSIVTGSTDSTAAVIATGASNIGDAISSLGSTLVVKIISNKAISNSKFGIYSQPYNGNFLVGGGSNTGGSVLKHFFSPNQMRQMSEIINSAQSTGLNYYPLLRDGERFPINDSNYPARLAPRPENDVEFFKGMLEGIAEIEYQCYQRLKEIGCPKVTRIFNMGGGSQNTVWTQMRQTRLQIPIITPTNTEAAYGSAILAYTSINNHYTS
jgi:sugar (pentulose or hexulose) kinase